MNTSASLLYHPCTVGTRCHYHPNHSSFLHREWKPAKRFHNKYPSICRNIPHQRLLPVSSAASTEQPSIEEVVTKLEQEQDAKPAPAPAPGPAVQKIPVSRGRTFTLQEDELVPDKVLTGRVKSIVAYGAFVDMGAKIDGLLHISKLGEGFVRNVADVLTVGQEVTVQIMDADIPNRRVSLKMFDPNPKPPPPPRSSPGTGTTTTGGREAFKGKIAGRGASTQTRGNNNRSKSKFQKGEEITGVVKNLTKRGCFVQLPGEEEGFLHANEISAAGDSVPIETLIKAGQEVKVKVLRVIDGRINLTMKEEFDLEKLNQEFNENIVATNPFELAFRKSAVLRKYLEKTGKLTTAESKEEILVKVEGAELDVTAEAEKDSDITKAEENVVTTSEEATESPSDDVPEEKKVEASIAPSTEPVDEPDENKVVEREPAEDDKVEATAEPKAEPEPQLEVEPVVNETVVEPKAEDIPQAATAQVEVSEPEEPVVVEPGVNDKEAEAVVEPKVEDIPQPTTAHVEVSEPVAESDLKDEPVVEEPKIQTGISAKVVKQLRDQSGAGMMDCKKALMETNGDLDKAVEYLRKKGLAGADKKASRIAAEGAIGSYVHDNRIGVLLEVNSETDFVSRGEIFTQLVEDLGMQVAASQQVEYVSVDDIPADMKNKETEIEMQREDIQSKPEAIRGKIVEGRVSKRLAELALLEQPFIKNDGILVKDLVKQTIASVGEKIQVRRFARYVLGEGLEKRSYDIAAEVAAQTVAKEQVDEKQVEQQDEKQVEAQADEEQSEGNTSISAALVKKLRDETGTGMMDCKKALVETEGDFDKAKEFLRKKGLASAEKKASRIAAEGLVVSYVHTGRIGVLMEINCETDFVSRNSVFKELADDLAMQVVACPMVEYVSVDDIPEQVKVKEKEIELQREDLQSKPEQIRGRIVDGRLAKMFAEKALLEQPYLKDDSIIIKDLIKKTTVSLGENIRVRRFVRYTLGEGIQKKSVSFAEEVAAATQSS